MPNRKYGLTKTTASSLPRRVNATAISDGTVSGSSAAEHGFYAEALRVHLGSLATGLGIGKIMRSSDAVRFVQGGVAKNLPLGDHDRI